MTEGYVISTDPKAGTSASEGDMVTIYISSGPKPTKIAVPLFTGMKERTAIKAIEDAGLTVGDIEEVDSDAEKGLVVWQSIPFGTEVAGGTTVKLQISKGPQATVKPSTQPSSLPSAVPTHVQPSDTPQQPTTKTFSVKLPQGEGNVHVRILVNGEVGYDQTVDRTNLSTIQPTLTGIGVSIVEVYFDGVLNATKTVDFSE